MSGQTAEPPSGGSAPPVPIRRTKARGGAEMVVLGQGTSRMGLDPAYRKQEVAALRLGLDLGMSVIDTAEGYADGGAEQVVAEAIRGRRDETFLTTKVLPDNASRQGTTAALEDSLRRLGTDRIDLYMLHAESTTGALEAPHPLEETLEAFEQLVHEQKILHYGVNNFDTDAMQAIEQFGLGKHIAANQVLYNLTARGIERGLIDWCTERDVVVMVYMPSVAAAAFCRRWSRSRDSIGHGKRHVVSRRRVVPIELGEIYLLCSVCADPIIASVLPSSEAPM